MPVPVPRRPQAFQLGGCRVANPVSAAHGRRLCEDLAYLLAASVEQFVDCGIDYNTGAASPLDLTAFATRSPGVTCLLIGAELREVDSGTATLAVTDDGTPLPWVESGGLDGSATLVTPPANSHRRPVLFGVADITGWTPGATPHRLRFRYTRGGNAVGLRRVFVRALPQGAVDPAYDATTEVSANIAWPYPRRGLRDGLVDGDVDSPIGWARLQAELERARTMVRIHRQWCTYEDDTYAAQTSSTVIGPLTWTTGWGAGDDVILPTRARRTFGTTAGTAVPETVKPYIRYKCGGTGGTLRFIINGTNHDRAVPAAAGWTTLGLNTFGLPTDQTNQRAQVQVHGAVATAGVLRLATLDLFTDED